MSKDHKHKRPIIIKKVKKAGHGGHHGGSWKVAYADFVTAMMAFFMVMWIVGMEQNLKEAIEGYFSNPVGYKKGYSVGTSILSSGNSPAQVKKPPIKMIVHAAEEKKFSDVEQKLRAAIEAQRGKLGTAQIEITVTQAGLRIELMESNSADTFFPSGSATMKPTLVLALQLGAAELGELQNPLVVEGHTDGAVYGDGHYSNWELSADRANAARRVLESAGIPPQRIAEVRGYADKRLRVPADPMAPQNRRISILLPFTDIPEPRDTTAPPKAEAAPIS